MAKRSAEEANLDLRDETVDEGKSSDHMNTKDNEDEDEDEEDDEDYDPLKKPEEEGQISEPSEDEDEPDYSAINTGVSQVRTRTQRLDDELGTGSNKAGHRTGELVQKLLDLDVDAAFASLKKGENDDWAQLIQRPPSVKQEQPKPIVADTEANQTIRIETSYTFAGKLVKESKLVDANSAEAKAYLESTSGIQLSAKNEDQRRLYVTVVREAKGTGEKIPLIIKLKRPSLIDKFLAHGDKKNKLTTLEKSRLDWASYVDEKRIKDELSLHNKAGYLDKQDFLSRMDQKRDVHYQRAKQLDRQQKWQQQQKANNQ